MNNSAVTKIGSAPSNIALIKYMGKTDYADNRPTNSSLSLTLESLRTKVRITRLQDNMASDQWRPLNEEGVIPIHLSEKSQIRYLKHFQMLKEQFGIKDSFIIESANTFPSDCGLASSASSFAALTSTSIELFCEISGQSKPSAQVIMNLSRAGSGSSCRSLVSPWGLWDKDEDVRSIEIPYQNLSHQVVIVEDTKKMVSSSEAHKRVITSDLFQGRPERAELRLQNLISAFQKQNWSLAYEITWAEFWDMHALFETSKPHFGYMTKGSLDVLRTLDHEWQLRGDGPLVTMDAGANIHLIYREDQAKIKEELTEKLTQSYRVYTSNQPQEISRD
ncbi:MAG: diphosphomevalonate decarboxylase [Oligoflexia bacterium]|nr:MAG: diphosphomevalonate decarboxylase [Oligoflexia bacterium]